MHQCGSTAFFLLVYLVALVTSEQLHGHISADGAITVATRNPGVQGLIINGDPDGAPTPRWKQMLGICHTLGVNCSRTQAVHVGESGTNGYGRCNKTEINPEGRWRKLLGSKLAHRDALELISTGGKDLFSQENFLFSCIS